MEDTGYRCPECGSTAEFYADIVILTGRTRITADGWNWADYGNDAQFDDGTTMECGRCGHKGSPFSFEER